MAMVGVAVLVGLDPIPLSGVVLLSVGASLLAALCYALAGVYAKRMFSDVPALALGIGRQAGRRSCTPGRRQPTRRDSVPHGRALRAGIGFALDGGRLPALLPPHRQRRTHEDPKRDVLWCLSSLCCSAFYS